MPVLFCKYLRNKSLDLHEILYGGQLLSCELKFQISCRSVHKCANTSVKARAHVLSRERAFTTPARAFMHGSS